VRRAGFNYHREVIEGIGEIASIDHYDDDEVFINPT
jgi:hypothetical protein